MERWKSIFEIYRSVITLWPITAPKRTKKLTVFIKIAPGYCGWDILGSKWMFCPQSWCVAREKIGQHKDLFDFYMSQTFSPQSLIIFWDVPSPQGWGPETESWFIDAQHGPVKIMLHHCCPNLSYHVATKRLMLVPTERLQNTVHRHAALMNCPLDF